MEIRGGRRLTSDLYLMYQQTESVGILVNEYILGLKLGFVFLRHLARGIYNEAGENLGREFPYPEK
jgi:hypothetical protein